MSSASPSTGVPDGEYLNVVGFENDQEKCLATPKNTLLATPHPPHGNTPPSQHSSIPKTARGQGTTPHKEISILLTPSATNKNEAKPF